MSEISYDSNDCLNNLFKIVEEIPSGVSEENIKDVLPFITHSSELLNDTKNQIISDLKQTLNIFWEEYNLTEKIYHMRELERKAPQDIKAWRPLVGEANIKPLTALVLKKRKELLKKELHKTSAELESVQKYLMDCRENLEKQGRDMENILS